jgi:hypothetical protein
MRSGFIRHPLSELWGNMPDEALIDLAEDIKQNGQKEAVVMYEGMVARRLEQVPGVSNSGCRGSG